jgi:soluble lytic murein transglycosylase-like protein
MLMATPEQIAQSAIAEESNIDQIKGDKMLSIERQQQWVTTWLAKRYRVANDASNMLVSAAYVTAKEIKLDPLLILSVMAIESGLNPFAESPVGAQGLMQVMSKVHHEKFEDMGGVKAALNPVANIKVGALILKDYVTRGGSVEAGLKMYVGAAAFDTDGGYGSRVMAEYARLKDVAAGKRVPIFATTPLIPVIARPKEVIPPPALETVTDSKGISNEKKLREQIAQL